MSKNLKCFFFEDINDFSFEFFVYFVGMHRSKTRTKSSSSADIRPKSHMVNYVKIASIPQISRELQIKSDVQTINSKPEILGALQITSNAHISKKDPNATENNVVDS